MSPSKQPSHRDAIGWLVLPDQLFEPNLLPAIDIAHVLCREDMRLIAHEKFHVQRTVFYIAAMRCYADDLNKHGLNVTREPLEPSEHSYAEHVVRWARAHKLAVMHSFEIINKWQRVPLEEALREANIAYVAHPSPMFLTSTPQFAAYLKGSKRPFMKTFYERQRKRLNVLIHPDERPLGGKWSFDEDNRKPLPAQVVLPDVPKPQANRHRDDAQVLCAKLFGHNPGSEAEPWLPVTRLEASAWLESFLESRFSLFGPYEDALSHRGDVLFHSVLTPFLNVGLLTPQEVIERAQKSARDHDVPLNSLEGFLRQVIGWREFIRGIYEAHSERQNKLNFFNHGKKLSGAWYQGDTGIPPLDDTLSKVIRLGWAHHIERLMVVGNLMLLLEVHPHEAHRWFMEMFVDSSEWVMGPNVYGMALFSDGGIFATKPYICGSNYYRKMGNYGKGAWCDGVDGLYWRFIERHSTFLRNNARMHFAVQTQQRMPEARKVRIYQAADELQQRLTR